MTTKLFSLLVLGLYCVILIVSSIFEEDDEQKTHNFTRLYVVITGMFVIVNLP